MPKFIVVDSLPNTSDKEDTMSDPKTKKTSKTKRASKASNGIPAHINKMGTKAEKIRALWITGRYSRYKISKLMGISFQHVYNTTERGTKDYDPTKHSGPKS